MGAFAFIALTNLYINYPQRIVEVVSKNVYSFKRSSEDFDNLLSLLILIQCH